MCEQGFSVVRVAILQATALKEIDNKNKNDMM